jgi:hypothetical protein
VKKGTEGEIGERTLVLPIGEDEGAMRGEMGAVEEEEKRR